MDGKLDGGVFVCVRVFLCVFMYLVCVCFGFVCLDRRTELHYLLPGQ